MEAGWGEGGDGHDNHRSRLLSIIMAIRIPTQNEGHLSAVTNTNATSNTSSRDDTNKHA